MVRDSTGRIFQERAFFFPEGDAKPRIRALQYIDPNRHELYDCIVAQRTCFITTYARPAMTAMPAGMGGVEACRLRNSAWPGIYRTAGGAGAEDH